MADGTWPPPWYLRKVYGEPAIDTNPDSGPGIGWDLSFGFRFNATLDPTGDEGLTIGAHFSDADLARTFVKRQATPDQLRQFAAKLCWLAELADQYEAARRG